MSVLYIYLLATVLAHFVSGTNQHASYKEASDFCRGNGSTLASVRQLNEALLDSSTRISEYSPFWLPINKTKSSEWKWVDGSLYGSHIIGESGSVQHQDCAVIHSGDSILDESNCFQRRKDYLCDVKGKECPGSQICILVQGRNVSVHYGLHSWFTARNQCKKLKTDLATFYEQDMTSVTKIINQELTLRGQMQGHFWIGLARKQWSLDHKASGVTYNWTDSSDSRLECATISKDHAWHTTNCTEKHTFFCENDMPITGYKGINTTEEKLAVNFDKNPAANTGAVVGAVIGTVAGVLLLALVITGFVIYHRKQREPQPNVSPHGRDPEHAEVSRPLMNGTNEQSPLEQVPEHAKCAAEEKAENQPNEESSKMEKEGDTNSPEQPVSVNDKVEKEQSSNPDPLIEETAKEKENAQKDSKTDMNPNLRNEDDSDSKVTDSTKVDKEPDICPSSKPDEKGVQPDTVEGIITPLEAKPPHPEEKADSSAAENSQDKQNQMEQSQLEDCCKDIVGKVNEWMKNPQSFPKGVTHVDNSLKKKHCQVHILDSIKALALTEVNTEDTDAAENQADHTEELVKGNTVEAPTDSHDTEVNTGNIVAAENQAKQTEADLKESTLDATRDTGDKEKRSEDNSLVQRQEEGMKTQKGVIESNAYIYKKSVLNHLWTQHPKDFAKLSKTLISQFNKDMALRDTSSFEVICGFLGCLCKDYATKTTEMLVQKLMRVSDEEQKKDVLITLIGIGKQFKDVVKKHENKLRKLKNQNDYYVQRLLDLVPDKSKTNKKTAKPIHHPIEDEPED